MRARVGSRDQGQAIVAAAQAMQDAGYPYCFDGGTINGPTAGTADPDPDQLPAQCTGGKVGFDCTGLTLYAVYQGQADLQPGDVVYFDHNAANGLGIGSALTSPVAIRSFIDVGKRLYNLDIEIRVDRAVREAELSEAEMRKAKAEAQTEIYELIARLRVNEETKRLRPTEGELRRDD